MATLVVGFTGTREGISQAQSEILSTLLQRVHRPKAQFWHGNCEGADTQAAILADQIGFITVAWPGPDPKRWGDYTSKIMNTPDMYLSRNKTIVDGCQLLIACPLQVKMITRSGTWSTVRYAKKRNKTTFMIYPDGTLKLR
jgi:hypothetical protein